MVKVIDVSKHQGNVDFKKVKEAGYHAVIVRVGYSYNNGTLQLDDKFHDNMRSAAAAGLHTGVYMYSYNQSVASAKISAADVLKVIAPYKLTYPVYFDIEYEAFNLKAGKQLNTDITVAFLEEIEAAKYYAALYCSTDFISRYLDDSRLKKYDKWIAQYADKCTYTGSYGMWQHGVIGTVGVKGRDYTIPGSVPGVIGNCDVNIAYFDYPKIIANAGLNNPVDTTPKVPDLQELLNEIQELKRQLTESNNTLAAFKKGVADILAKYT